MLTLFLVLTLIVKIAMKTKWSEKGLTRKAENIVVIDAPMKPSHVFLGESLIRGVLPKKKPVKYAAISLITISKAGNRNL